uniref:Uncharacterized protein n=2 Tax=unclassified Caudoviricetes TaxID=2788787 RepID=A0A8S5LH15_9CAUD|nr:MAG TPA: hypothetical protein [Siphoviridae sp. ct5tj9]DAF61585.1 MAG TPA: hypothetical protein [Siphoviridae sp. ctJ0s2]
MVIKGTSSMLIPVLGLSISKSISLRVSGS